MSLCYYCESHSFTYFCVWLMRCGWFSFQTYTLEQYENEKANAYHNVWCDFMSMTMSKPLNHSNWNQLKWSSLHSVIRHLSFIVCPFQLTTYFFPLFTCLHCSLTLTVNNQHVRIQDRTYISMFVSLRILLRFYSPHSPSSSFILINITRNILHNFPL